MLPMSEYKSLERRQTGMPKRQLCKAAIVQWQCAHADDPAVCLVSLSPFKQLFRLQIGGRDAYPLTRDRYSATMCTRTCQRCDISVDGVADKVHDGPMN
jgi:hypothetical protein